MHRPDKDKEENKEFNYHVSKVRIGSEHCIGFLKGRWASLKGLRVAVNTEKGLKYATLWVQGCITLHAFAIRHEQGQDTSQDIFFQQGVRYMREQRKWEKRWRRARRWTTREDEEERDRANDIALLEGKLKRELLKQELQTYMD